jgi:hypothetical protein
MSIQDEAAKAAPTSKRLRPTKHDRPSIPIDDGRDFLDPCVKLADGYGLTERVFVEKYRKLGGRIGRHAGVNYASRNDAHELLTAAILGETPLKPKRKGRR